MIKVELFGLFRLDTGIKEFELDETKQHVSCVRDLYPILLAKAKEINPTTKITAKDIDGCIIIINDKQTKKSAKLKDGDRVQLMSPVCGG